MSVEEDDAVAIVQRKAARITLVPSILLSGAGLLNALAGFLLFVSGVWDCIANLGIDIEMIAQMVLAAAWFAVGGLVCYGAEQMQKLTSYSWAVASSILAILPFFIGLYVLTILMNPDVKAGFASARSEAPE